MAEPTVAELQAQLTTLGTQVSEALALKRQIAALARMARETMAGIE